MIDYKKKTIPSQPAAQADPDAVTRKELGGFAKKADLAPLAKREELAKYATKEELNAANLTVDLNGFALKKNLTDLISKEYLRAVIDSLGLGQLATKCELKDLASRRELEKLVTEEQLAKIVNPNKLAEFATKKGLEGRVAREELDSFLKTELAVLRKKEKQEIIGHLEVKGALTVNGKALKTEDCIERPSIRVINSAPAVVVRSDRNVIVNNSSSALFGVKLPKGEKGHELVIKDGSGSSYFASIVIEGFKLPEGKQETVDGQSKIFIRENYGFVRLVFNGKSWNIVGR